MPIDPTAALRTFRAIAAHGSFTRAARELDVSPSALSQALRTLETNLGTRLLQRTTRRVALTEAGQDLLARVGPALAEIDGALEDLRNRSGRPAGTLRITVPPIVVPMVLAPNLADFLRAYPEIRVDVRTDASLNDLVADGLDAGIRLAEKLQPGMVALPLGGPLCSMVVGSRAYLRKHGAPRHPSELSRHNCIQFRFDSNGPVYRWEFAHPSGPQRGRWFETDVNGNLTCNDTHLLMQAVLDGVGLAHVTQQQAQEPLDKGRLLSVLDAWLPPYDGLYLYYPSRFQVPPKLRVFADFLRERMR